MMYLVPDVPGKRQANAYCVLEMNALRGVPIQRDVSIFKSKLNDPHATGFSSITTVRVRKRGWYREAIFFSDKLQMARCQE